MNPVFVRNRDEPLRFKMKKCPERDYVVNLIANGGGIMLPGFDDDDNEDDDSGVIHLVPRGACPTRNNSVAAQYIFKSAVKNCSLDIDDFRMALPSDGTGFTHTSGDETNPWTLTEEAKIVSWLLANNRTTYLAGNLLWKDVVRELELTRCHKSVRIHFLSVIRPNLESYRDLIDPELAHRLSELRLAVVEASEIWGGNEVTPKNDLTTAFPRKRRTKPSRPVVFFETMGEPDEEMSIDVVGFTQSQGLSAPNSLTTDHSLLNLHGDNDRHESPDDLLPSPVKEESIDVTSCEPSLKEEDSVEPPNYRPVLKDELTEMSSIHLSLKEESLDILSQLPGTKTQSIKRPSPPPVLKKQKSLESTKNQLDNGESARLNGLKTSSTVASSDESLVRLYNRCVTNPISSLSREAGESSEADSFANLLRRASKPIMADPMEVPVKAPKQAETIEEVVQELSAFYGVTPEAAKKALRDARYSVKAAICRIINTRNVSHIEACHRETC